VPLTALEFRLFQTLFAAPGRVFSRDALLEKLYPTGDIYVLDRTILGPYDRASGGRCIVGEKSRILPPRFKGDVSVL
jgi:hypothetical protein